MPRACGSDVEDKGMGKCGLIGKGADFTREHLATANNIKKWRDDSDDQSQINLDQTKKAPVLKNGV